MTIEERKNKILAKIAEMKANGENIEILTPDTNESKTEEVEE